MASTTESVQPVFVPHDYDEGAESINDYKPGGFHPTHLGDLLGQEGRYRVVHKLGHGGFGTVWLCRDLKEDKWNAVKILAAAHSTGHCADLRICEMLSGLSPRETDVRFSHVVVPEDHFWHEGPNGNHLCVVMPVLGPSLQDVAEEHLWQETPLKKICYQLVLAMKFLHDKGICHGDFRPFNFCYVLRGFEDLTEEELVRVLGRPKLLCYVDNGEYDWHSDFGGDEEEFDTDGIFYGTSETDADESDAASSPEVAEGCAQIDVNSHEPRYIVVPPYLSHSSEYVSDDIAVIDFGESFLSSDAPGRTGIPRTYCPPEGCLDDCGTFGLASDIWALGCSIFEIRSGLQPFEASDLWELLGDLEDLNGPMPEPYRSALANLEGDVPEDASEWVCLDEDARKRRERQNMKRTGVPGTLHSMLLLEQRCTVPLAEGEGQPPPPPRGRGTRGSPMALPGRKVVAYEMSEREALELMDLFKKIFAWKPENRTGVAEILSHAWFNSCREGDHMHMVVSHSESMDSDIDGPGLAEVPDCGIFLYLPAAIRRLLWLNGRGGWW